MLYCTFSWLYKLVISYNQLNFSGPGFFSMAACKCLFMKEKKQGCSREYDLI